jgi:hypothetical protein
MVIKDFESTNLTMCVESLSNDIVVTISILVQLQAKKNNTRCQIHRSNAITLTLKLEILYFCMMCVVIKILAPFLEFCKRIYN